MITRFLVFTLLNAAMLVPFTPAAGAAETEGLSFEAALRAADLRAPQLQARRASLSGAQECWFPSKIDPGFSSNFDPGFGCPV